VAPCSEIAIPNIDPPVFLSILEFLYTGTLELKVDTVFQIYKSADQYLLEDVKTACRSFINLSMTQEHALTLLENARMCKFMEIYQAPAAPPPVDPQNSAETGRWGPNGLGACEGCSCAYPISGVPQFCGGARFGAAENGNVPHVDGGDHLRSPR
jgi:hypothetical protein